MFEVHSPDAGNQRGDGNHCRPAGHGAHVFVLSHADLGERSLERRTERLSDILLTSANSKELIVEILEQQPKFRCGEWTVEPAVREPLQTPFEGIDGAMQCQHVASQSKNSLCCIDPFFRKNLVFDLVEIVLDTVHRCGVADDDPFEKAMDNRRGSQCQRLRVGLERRSNFAEDRRFIMGHAKHE